MAQRKGWSRITSASLIARRLRKENLEVSNTPCIDIWVHTVNLQYLCQSNSSEHILTSYSKPDRRFILQNSSIATNPVQIVARIMRSTLFELIALLAVATSAVPMDKPASRSSTHDVGELDVAYSSAALEKRSWFEPNAPCVGISLH